MLLPEKEGQASEQRSEQPYVYISHICKLYVSYMYGATYGAYICKYVAIYITDLSHLRGRRE